MYFHIVKIQGELFNLHTGAKNHNESKNSSVENRIFQEIHILKIILFHIIHIFFTKFKSQDSQISHFSHISHLFIYRIQVNLWTKSVILPLCEI